MTPAYDYPVAMVEVIEEINQWDIDGTEFVQRMRNCGYRIIPADMHDSCPTCDSIQPATTNCLLCDLPHPTPPTEPSACTDSWHH